MHNPQEVCSNNEERREYSISMFLTSMIPLLLFILLVLFWVSWSNFWSWSDFWDNRRTIITTTHKKRLPGQMKMETPTNSYLILLHSNYILTWQKTWKTWQDRINPYILLKNMTGKNCIIKPVFKIKFKYLGLDQITGTKSTRFGHSGPDWTEPYFFFKSHNIRKYTSETQLKSPESLFQFLEMSRAFSFLHYGRGFCFEIA